MLDIPESRRNVLKSLGLGAGALATGSLDGEGVAEKVKNQVNKAAKKSSKRVAADPTDIPDPINRYEPKHHEVELECKEVTAEIEDGVTFDFMTFGGQIPGPMIRVRQGDTVELTLKNLPDNAMPHNVDLHAVYGTGGGNVATTANPGEENAMKFEAKYPGAFIYHCAVPNLDMHISSGMFGMILVEPKDGLPEVDREFYLGQHEVYTDKPAGEKGHHKFDMDAMVNENPTYVLLNGEKYALTPDNRGALKAKTGETARVYFVAGGPNLSSNFHPIGNVWSKAYRDGAVDDEPEKDIQTMKVPPGSCMVGTLNFPVPERIKLVDHALSRVVRKGMLGMIDVEGKERTGIFDPEPGKKGKKDEEGPMY